MLVGRDVFWCCVFQPWEGMSECSAPGCVLGLVFMCNWLCINLLHHPLLWVSPSPAPREGRDLHSGLVPRLWGSCVCRCY